ncbi:MAG TPA: nickel/cobalt transporter [Xanthobacteraceae bacterium]|nr:nickel/cobalt transporter [Xanthobacteraceae bacterium]
MSPARNSAARNARRRARLLLAVGLFASFVMALGIDATCAQGPFGMGAAPPHPPGGFAGWVLAKQAEYYRALGAMIRAAKADGSAAVGLLGLSFAYGIFHAAGPGHGKAVISSYLVANEETWRRGVVLSFAAALLQALIAVGIVGIAAALIGATAKMMGDTVRVIETLSYLLIMALGARLLWVKGNGFAAALHETLAPTVALRPAGAAVAIGPATPPPHGHPHDPHDHHPHEPFGHGDHDHAGTPHAHAGACDHAHGPEPQTLAGRGGWTRGFSAIVAVGLRPCSGAILVLVFALAQGLFPLGVAATLVMGLGTAITVAAIATFAVCAKGMAQRLARHRAGYGALLMRGLECAAAAAVLGFGALLLAGYLATERMFAV